MSECDACCLPCVALFACFSLVVGHNQGDACCRNCGCCCGKGSSRGLDDYMKESEAEEGLRRQHQMAQQQGAPVMTPPPSYDPSARSGPQRSRRSEHGQGQEYETRRSRAYDQDTRKSKAYDQDTRRSRAAHGNARRDEFGQIQPEFDSAGPSMYPPPRLYNPDDPSTYPPPPQDARGQNEMMRRSMSGGARRERSSSRAGETGRPTDDVPPPPMPTPGSYPPAGFSHLNGQPHTEYPPRRSPSDPYGGRRDTRVAPRQSGEDLDAQYAYGSSNGAGGLHHSRSWQERERPPPMPSAQPQPQAQQLPYPGESNDYRGEYRPEQEAPRQLQPGRPRANSRGEALSQSPPPLQRDLSRQPSGSWQDHNSRPYEQPRELPNPYLASSEVMAQSPPMPASYLPSTTNAPQPRHRQEPSGSMPNPYSENRAY